MDDGIGDELLSLIFTTLRLSRGLTTDEIARAFLSNGATIA
jgi:predicted RNA polymerase sigma factor